MMSKLLIIDDSQDLLLMMKKILERSGHIVKTLTNADNICEEIHQFNPDLLILDILLAGADGREICSILKKAADTQNLRILAFSASPKNSSDYRSYHADDFMEKPFDIKILLDKINSLLLPAAVDEIHSVDTGTRASAKS